MFCLKRYLVFLILVVGCSQTSHTQSGAVKALDLSHNGQYTSGAWTYTYSISDPGTRSEGTHGALSYGRTELSDPIHSNDFYETPWGRLYWVGQPVVPFGSHGWMPQPLARKPIGQALIDPALVHSGRFRVQCELLAPEELATPDRLEQDPNVLVALKPFGLTQAHMQRHWFRIGSSPITLHDTKLWGTLVVNRADTNQSRGPTLVFSGTSNLAVDTLPKPASLQELLAPTESPAQADRMTLSPQVNTLQPIKCTLTPVTGDPLVLYLVCSIEAKGRERNSL